MDPVLTLFTWAFFGSIAYYFSKLSWYFFLALWSWRQDIKTARAMATPVNPELLAAHEAYLLSVQRKTALFRQETDRIKRQIEELDATLKYGSLGHA